MPDDEVVKAEAASVPALVETPSVELTAEDIALPSLKLGQFASDYVKESMVPAGCLFSVTGQDDPDPVVLWEQGDDELLTFHPLALRKGKSVSEGGELVLFSYDDPNAPEGAWTTYQYMIALPEVDSEMPYKFLLTRTGKPAAQQINTVIAKNMATKPAYELAFTVDCVKRENKKGKFHVPRVKHVEAKDENIKIAEALASMVPADQPSTSAAESAEEPAI